MEVNREIFGVVLDHLWTPGGVDGACMCEAEEAIGERAADHLINELVKHFNLPWTREYDKGIDGFWPPAWCENTDEIRHLLDNPPEENTMANGPDDFEPYATETEVDATEGAIALLLALSNQVESVSLYEARQIAIDSALQLQHHTNKYATADALCEEAQTIYEFLTQNVPGA